MSVGMTTMRGADSSALSCSLPKCAETSGGRDRAVRTAATSAKIVVKSATKSVGPRPVVT